MGIVRAILGVGLLLLLTLVLLPFHLLCLLSYPKGASRLVLLWHRVAARVIDVRVRVEGSPIDGPVLYLPNHVSWLDILILSSTAPLCFVAKADVKSWPVISWLAQLQRTIFVDREHRSKTGLTLADMTRRLKNGGRLVLFAEGTSGDGWQVLPFKSALIGAVVGAAKNIEHEDQTFHVQPVGIVYSRLHGIVLGRNEAHFSAWVGDIDLIGHLWQVMKTGGLEAVVRYGNPIEVSHETNRKALAKRVEAEVGLLVSQARFGGSDLV